MPCVCFADGVRLFVCVCGGIKGCAGPFEAVLSQPPLWTLGASAEAEENNRGTSLLAGLGAYQGCYYR